MNMPVFGRLLVGAAIVTCEYLLFGWWLDSGRTVAMTAAAIATAAFFGARSLVHATAITGGAMGSSIALLFWIGPGNLWPIVIGIGTALLGFAALVGFLCRRVISMATRQESNEHRAPRN